MCVYTNLSVKVHLKLNIIDQHASEVCDFLRIEFCQFVHRCFSKLATQPITQMYCYNGTCHSFTQSHSLITIQMLVSQGPYTTWLITSGILVLKEIKDWLQELHK